MTDGQPQWKVTYSTDSVLRPNEKMLLAKGKSNWEKRNSAVQRSNDNSDAMWRRALYYDEKTKAYNAKYWDMLDQHVQEAHERAARRTARASEQLAKRKRTGVRKPLKVKPAPKRPTEREVQRIDRAVARVQRGMEVLPSNRY
jgi:beta-glucosidase-like glycosyl hydrolase